MDSLAVRQGGHDRVPHDLAHRRMDQQEEGDDEQRTHDQHQAEPLEAPEAPRAHGGNDGASGKDHGRQLGEAQIADRQGDPDELGHDGQGIQHEQVDDAEGAPELPEALEDQSRMPDAGDRSQPEDHLLVDVEHRDQEEERPHEVGPVVLTGLGVGTECPGVVVTSHDDEPGADDGQQRLGLERQSATRTRIALRDGAERTVDVPEVGFVENGSVPGRSPVRAGWCEMHVHEISLTLWAGRANHRDAPRRGARDAEVSAPPSVLARSAACG